MDTTGRSDKNQEANKVSAGNKVLRFHRARPAAGAVGSRASKTSASNTPATKKSGASNPKKAAISPAATMLAEQQAAQKSIDTSLSTLALILVPTILLVAIGLIMVLSASSVVELKNSGSAFVLAGKHTIFILAGSFGALILAFLPTKFFNSALCWLIFLFTLGLQALLLIPGLGKATGGNTNWVRIAGFQFQPSEFLKWGLVLWLARMLADNYQEPLSRKFVFPAGVGALAAIGAVMIGHDMGTAIVFVAIIAAMFVISGFPWKLAGFLSLIGLAAASFLVVISSSRRIRVLQFLGFLPPDPQGSGYQPLHGRYALGSGGLSGLGLGASREKWSYLPAAANDYIFAIIGEEIGLFGTMLILVLFCILGYGGYRLAKNSTSVFVKLLASGITAWLLGQALINMGVVVEILPVIGVPLPFISAGGSALISCLAAIGLLISCVRSDPSRLRLSRVSARQAKKTSSVVAYGLRARKNRGK